MNYKHGHYLNGKRSFEYVVWANMLQRCNNPNDTEYHNYGGRGIKVCECWHDFRNFFADMGKKPQDLTLERKDNNGNYESSNCCWVTSMEQAANTRNLHMFIAMDCQGTMIASNNQSEFARQYELNSGHISSCLHGKRKQHKGWRFRWIQNLTM